jgi:hypothetical protein
MASARLLKSWKEIYDALGCTGFSLTGRHAEQLRPRTSAPPPEQAHSANCSTEAIAREVQAFRALTSFSFGRWPCRPRVTTTKNGTPLLPSVHTPRINPVALARLLARARGLVRNLLECADFEQKSSLLS